MMEVQKIPHYVKPTLSRLHSGDVIVCQISESKEAVNGFLYFTSRDSRPVGGATFRWLKAQGAIVPDSPGLLDDYPQTYRIAPHG